MVIAFQKLKDHSPTFWILKMGDKTDITLYRNGYGIATQNNVPNLIPTYYHGERSYFRFFLINSNGLQYQANNPVTFYVSIGSQDQYPVRGEWKIGTGAATGSAVSFNASTADLLNAISGVYGNVNVVSYGSAVSGYVITAATANTALTINGDVMSLSPSSKVEVINLVTQGSGVAAKKLVRLRRNPALSLVTNLNSTTLATPSITSSGIGAASGPWYISIPDDARTYPYYLNLNVTLDGVVSLSFTGAAQIQTNLPASSLGDSSAGQGSISSQLNSQAVLFNTSSAGGYVNQVTGSGTSYNTVTRYGVRLDELVKFKSEAWGTTGFRITATPVTSGITTSVTMASDSGGYIFSSAQYAVGSVTFDGGNLNEYFSEAKSSRISLTLEVAIDEGSGRCVLLQTPVTIVRNLA